MTKADRMPGGRFTRSALANAPASNFDKIGRDWTKWVKLWKNWYVCSIWIREDSPDPDIELYMPARENHLSRAVSIILTDYTESEIIAMRELFEFMFDAAQPICRARDERAQERYEAGEDTDKRLYRAVASVFTRPWASGINAESLLQRLEQLPSAQRIIQRRNERLGIGSLSVAEANARIGVTGNDDETTVELEGLR